ncbi:SDR family oxidoreductase [Streptomyces sp. NPDC056663]|uniref:SDR family oxidoreductase n=1 Tax=Streptomyces sp. NPDC056663 TaxID=3345899 RepID=UPI0036BBF519
MSLPGADREGLPLPVFPGLSRTGAGCRTLVGRAHRTVPTEQREEPDEDPRHRRHRNRLRPCRTPARQLASSGHQLVALVRDPSKADLPAGITIVKGDLTDASAVRRALDCTDWAFLNMADDNGAVFAEAAVEAGLGHTVLLSSFTAVTELPSGPANIITARHQAGERALAQAGVPSTFLRAAGFDYNILMWVASAADGVVRAPNADVKLPVVDPADIASAAVAVLTAADPKPGAYSITGP